MYSGSVVESILRGDLDDDFDEIKDAMKERKEFLDRGNFIRSKWDNEFD